jgi:hypothetical protein
MAAYSRVCAECFIAGSVCLVPEFNTSQYRDLGDCNHVALPHALPNWFDCVLTARNLIRKAPGDSIHSIRLCNDVDPAFIPC